MPWRDVHPLEPLNGTLELLLAAVDSIRRADVVKVWLDRIVADLSHMPDVVLTVGPNSYNIDVGRWPKS